jgi:hypothetical protein
MNKLIVSPDYQIRFSPANESDVNQSESNIYAQSEEFNIVEGSASATAINSPSSTGSPNVPTSETQSSLTPNPTQTPGTSTTPTYPTATQSTPEQSSGQSPTPSTPEQSSGQSSTPSTSQSMQTSAPSTGEPTGSSSGLSKGAIVGIAIGVALGLLALIGITLYLWKRKRNIAKGNASTARLSTNLGSYQADIVGSPKEIVDEPQTEIPSGRINASFESPESDPRGEV